MNKKIKCIEYYFDSKMYNKQEVIENMNKEQLEFPKKEKTEIEISLNEYGIYVVKLKFVNNELTVFKNKKTKKYKKNKYEYGKYKETKTYSPI